MCYYFGIWHFCLFWDNQQNLFYFFIYDDVRHIESNNLVQKPIGAFLIWQFS